MKKILILLFISSFLSSCSTSKTVRVSKKTIKGDWTINNVTYDTSGNYKVSLFNDVSKECFEGSTWHFIPNNFTGNYVINGSDCKTGERYFRFNIQEVDKETGLYSFLLKPTDDKYKSENNSGFRLKLSHLSDMEMQWQQKVNVNGKPFIITLNFIKNQNE